MTTNKTMPFLYGTQYYRAPTPERRYWAEDLKRITRAGYNCVKFWAQWRWNHRGPGRWYFDDLDELMDLAAANSLAVTFNVIFDTAPDWLFDEHPDAHMITAAGRKLVSQTVVCRQIGGYPGPCFNHDGAWEHRAAFLRTLAARYHKHPAMDMWDTWNEPESNLLFRDPKPDTLVCYCEHCRAKFLGWLRAKYQTVEHLNNVWGRCYDDFSRVELPRDPMTFTDMVDWRLFQQASLAAEGRRRMAAVREVDKTHPVYQHPVPNTVCFNAITGIDTFDAAEECDCFAGSVLGFPVNPLHIVSAARGRVCYATEIHLRPGMTGMYARELTLRDIAWEFVPQIGLGMRGFMFWQYRCETLGAESPAWGLLDPNSLPGQTHEAAAEFWRRLRPIAPKLMSAKAEDPAVGVYLSSANEILHWCIYGNLEGLRSDTYRFTNLLYDRNVRLAYVDERVIRDGLPASMKLLILPWVYGLDEQTARAIQQWVEDGGTLLCEAHAGAYDLTTGRHCLNVPGLGLAEAFGLAEAHPTAARHLNLSDTSEGGGTVLGDVSKAFEAHGQKSGNLVPLKLADGSTFWGKNHYAELAGEGIEPIASLPQRPPCIGGKRVGEGYVFYIGTLIAWDQQAKDPAAMQSLMNRVLSRANVPTSVPPWVNLPVGVRVDRLTTRDGEAYAVTNATSAEVRLHIHTAAPLRSLMTDAIIAAGDNATYTLAPGWADLVVPTRWCVHTHP